MIAASPRGTAAFSAWVGNDSKTAVDIAEINISLIPRSDLSHFLALVQRQFPGLLTTPMAQSPQRNRGMGRLVSGNGTLKVRPISTISRAESEAELREILKGETATETQPASGNYATAQLNIDGDLIGVAHLLDAAGDARPIGGDIFFVNQGRIVERLPIKASGFFRTKNVRPSTYSIFINSPHGFTASGIRVVDVKTPVIPTPRASRAKVPVKAASMQQQPPTTQQPSQTQIQAPRRKTIMR